MTKKEIQNEIAKLQGDYQRAHDLRAAIVDDTTKEHEADDYLAIMASCCVAVKKLKRELAEL